MACRTVIYTIHKTDKILWKYVCEIDKSKNKQLKWHVYKPVPGHWGTVPLTDGPECVYYAWFHQQPGTKFCDTEFLPPILIPPKAWFCCTMTVTGQLQKPLLPFGRSTRKLMRDVMKEQQRALDIIVNNQVQLNVWNFVVVYLKRCPHFRYRADEESADAQLRHAERCILVWLFLIHIFFLGMFKTC